MNRPSTRQIDRFDRRRNPEHRLRRAGDRWRETLDMVWGDQKAKEGSQLILNGEPTTSFLLQATRKTSKMNFLQRGGVPFSVCGTSWCKAPVHLSARFLFKKYRSERSPGNIVVILRHAHGEATPCLITGHNAFVQQQKENNNEDHNRSKINNAPMCIRGAQKPF